MIREFDVAFHVTGTMAADLDIRWNVPDDCQLLHLSAVTSTDDASTMTIGDETTANLHLAAYAIGLGANTVYERGDASAFANWATGQYPRIQDGDTIVIAVDHDGDGGTSGANLTLVLRFAEG